MPSETRTKMEKSIALGVIGKGTIQKQYLSHYADMHPEFRSGDVISGWKLFKDDIIARYVAGEGSTQIVKELYRRYGIKITTNTLITWLRSYGVPIRKPTTDRKRLPRTPWEKKLWNRIEKIRSQVKSIERQKQIELQGKNELISLLRSQIDDLAKENFNLRQEVGRLTRVVETLKTVKTGD